jgi:hypothetical protein
LTESQSQPSKWLRLLQHVSSSYFSYPHRLSQHAKRQFSQQALVIIPAQETIQNAASPLWVPVNFALETQRTHIPETMGVLEEVQEARVETICLSEEVVRRAVEALKGQVRGNLEFWAAFTLRRVVMD